MSKFKIAKQIPREVLLKRIIKKVLPGAKIKYAQTEFRSKASEHTLESLVSIAPIDSGNKERIAHYLRGEYDLLGSGWVNRLSSSKPNLPKVHQAFSLELYGHLSEGYEVVDWQKEIKTGYSYDIQKQSNKQESQANTDIKNCWEIGRLQHLPQLALHTSDGLSTETLVRFFKDHCLDFIASNPVGMGVQWGCAMDVGIRVCNMLLAYDLIQPRDEQKVLDEFFQSVFADSIYQHGKFIYDNLEHKEGAAGNHYLFNLVGLLFVCNYLSASEEIDLWHAFATDQLITEFNKQFFSDGTNFEGSTTYHCLSSEAVLYGMAFVLANGECVNDKTLIKLKGAGHFIADAMKQDGSLPQFGDNDSGRLFKLTNEEDNLLNYESLMACFSGLFTGGFEDFQHSHSLHVSLIEQLAKSIKIDAEYIYKDPQPKGEYVGFEEEETTTIEFGSTIDTNKIEALSYSDFGLTIFKSSDFYLAISAIANPKMHHSWGHVHNDKLSFELQVAGKNLVQDPGSFVYTSDAKTRDLFRSSAAHNGIVIEGLEQNKLIHPFYMDRESTCEVLEQTNTTAILLVKYYGVEHIRKFEIHSDKLVITDTCNKPFKPNINVFKQYSPNYGSLS